MKAIVLQEPGKPEGLRTVEAPAPDLGPRDVLVRVRACGVCYHDVVVTLGVLRRGIKERLILGHEIAGEVVETGPRVDRLTRGQRVASILTDICGVCSRCISGNEHRCLEGHGIGHSIDGGYAEYVKVAEPSLRPIPDGVTFEEAAICACPIGVPLRALRDLARPKPGESVLVTGAGGGLGVHTMQIAALHGARVFGVTSSPEKAERLQGLGAGEVVVSPGGDFHWDILALTDDQGVEVVVENAGSPTFEASFKSLGQYGRMVLLGETAGREISMNPANFMFKDARLFGSTGACRRDLDEALGLVASKRIRPVITSFSLEDAPKVHRMLMDRQLFGRAVLIP